MPLLRSKVVVRSIPVWGTKSGSRERNLADRDKPVRLVWNPVRPVWVPIQRDQDEPVRPVLEPIRLI
jgi:hypothetical protein